MSGLLRAVAGVMVALAGSAMLVVVLRAYQDPVHVAQWVAQLQLCR